jgi:hypothetical protein
MWKRNGPMLVLLAALSGVVKAQENPPAQAPAASAEQAPADGAQNPPSTAIPAPPRPGPEVMRPTEHGLRLTPGLARAFGRSMALGSRKDLNTTPEQRQQLGDRFAKCLMDVGRKHQKEVQPALEYLLATVIEQEGKGPGLKLSPETAREFGERCAPLALAAREALDALEQEATPILKPDQQEALRKHLQEPRAGIKQFEDTLKRWAQGEYHESDNPFEPDNKTQSSRNGTDGKDGEGGATKPTKPEMRNAEAVADSQMEQFGPTEWNYLLQTTVRAFNFDEQQRAKATQLLADYRAKADAIMTPEWKQAMRANRIKAHLNNWLRGQPSRPFFFHLQQDYARLGKPVNDLGLAFRADLLALVTPEQRAAAIAEVQSTAAAVGLSMKPTDEELLGLAATQPVAAAP